MTQTDHQPPEYSYSHTKDEKNADDSDTKFFADTKDESVTAQASEYALARSPSYKFHANSNRVTTRRQLLEEYHAVNNQVQNFTLGFLREDKRWAHDTKSQKTKYKENLARREYWIEWGSDAQVEEMTHRAKQELSRLHNLQKSRLEMYELEDDKILGFDEERHKDCTQQECQAGYSWFCPVWGERKRPASPREMHEINRQAELKEERAQMFSKICSWFK